MFPGVEMVESLVDVVFPVTLLALPTLAAIWLAKLVFGAKETFAFLRGVGNNVLGTVVFFAARLRRGLIAFLSDEAVPAVGEERVGEHGVLRSEFEEEVERLEDRIDRRVEDLAALEEKFELLRKSVSELETSLHAT